MSTSIYTVYWIHYPDEQDPFKDGYIGITNNLNRRIAEHMSSNKHMRNRIHKGAVVEPLHESLSYEEACTTEFNYRPLECIGWNISKGGNIPPSHKGRKFPNSKKGEERSDRQKKAAKRHSKLMKGKAAPNKKAVVMFGEVFEAVTHAMSKLGITYTQYRYYMKHPDVADVQELKQKVWEDRNNRTSAKKLANSDCGTYVITCPDGTTVTVNNNIEEWCKNHGIYSSNLRRLGGSKGYVCSYTPRRIVNDK